MRGFSLIELLVAVTIAGVLAAIALPGYSHAVRRALRQDARLALLRIQHEQERFFANHLNYAVRLGSGDSSGLPIPGHSDGGNYLLQLQTSADRMTYTASARINPDGRQASDSQCAQLAIDETGHRRSADSGNRWRDDDPHRCWD
jgi:type IV pilus assembly protein PilE